MQNIKFPQNEKVYPNECDINIKSSVTDKAWYNTINYLEHICISLLAIKFL